MSSRHRLSILTLGLTAAVVGPLAGQAKSHGVRQASDSDSARIVGAARSAQRRVERIRRRLLPRGYSGHGPCDVRIGQYCYWLFTDDPKPAGPEPPELVAAREDLLAVLDSAAERDAEGRWIRGQRVRYLVEAGRLPEATRAATGCGALHAWWCPALQGYVAHVAGDFTRAEAAYATALSLMPAEQRCTWEDISELLTGDLRGRYRDLSCEGRDEYQRRLLWLADPLVVAAGNELWTEHLTRHVYAALRDDAHGVEGARWTRTMVDGLIRYGRPVWWEADMDRRWGAVGDEGIITHSSPNGRYYFPRLDNARDLAAIRDESWALRWRRAPATHAPGHDAGHLDELDQELTWWPMGDSTGIIAFLEIEDDSLAPGDSIRMLVASSPAPEAGWKIRDTVVTTRHAALGLVVPTAPQVLSIEALAVSSNRAGRTRFGVDPTPTTTVALSDVLVLSGADADSLPAHRREAMRRLDPRATFHAGEELHLYWELFSREPTPVPVSASLQLRKTGRSLLRRVAELTPFASREEPVSLSWRELARPVQDLFPWAIAVTLPDVVSSGRYTFTLVVETAAGQRFERQREIEIVR